MSSSASTSRDSSSHTSAPPPSSSSSSSKPSPQVHVHDFSDSRHLSPASAEETNRRAASESSARTVLTREAILSNYNFVRKQPYDTLNTGHRIPLVGLGTWNASKGEVGAAVSTAIRCGYRHVDCAAVYGNEREIGDAFSAVFSEGVVSREELFVTSKLWNTEHSPARVPVACGRTLADLRLNYLDLYLMHWPVTGVPGSTVTPALTATWQAMEGLVKEGLAKSIGVCNFSIPKLKALLEDVESRKAKGDESAVKPAVLQVEVHPYFRNDDLIAFAKENGIHVTAYSPLGSPDSSASTGRKKPRPRILRDAKVAAVAMKHGKTNSQVLVKWAVQRGTSCLPKSTNVQHIKENLEASMEHADAAHPGLEWKLEPEDMATLSAFEPQVRMVDGSFFVNPRGPYTSLAVLWDDPLDDSREDNYVRSLYDLEMPKLVPAAAIRSYDTRSKSITKVSIPLLGFGTYFPGGKDLVRSCVMEAVRMGYRHLDTASYYDNLSEIGAALADLINNDGLVTREDLFITSKLWNDEHERVEEACRSCLKDLNLEYLDLYHMHWPITENTGDELQPPLADTWKEMEKLVHLGLVRSIGISNFSIRKLSALLADLEKRRAAGDSNVVQPSVLQVEAHPYFPNADLVAFARKNGILVTAYAPLGHKNPVKGDSEMIEEEENAKKFSHGPIYDPVIKEAAAKLDVSPSQLILKWAIQRGTNPIPKSSDLTRMKDNLRSVTVQVPEEVMAKINALTERVRLVKGDQFLVPGGPYKNVEDLWDDAEGL